MKHIKSLILPFLLSGCATNFVGAAKVPGGPNGCQNECSARGLEFGGMVLMGEYTDGCICLAPGADTSEATVGAGAVAGASGGVGVVMHAQRAAAASAQR